MFDFPCLVAATRTDWLYQAMLWTIRSALLLYAATLLLAMASGGSRPSSQRVSWRVVRWCWTVALACYLAHVGLAFHVVHGWSHAHAFEHTAAKTERIVGWSFGAGIYFNHLLTVLWMADVAWWWISSRSYLRRSSWFGRGLHGYMLLLAINATVVFEQGIIRWSGLAVLLVLAGYWAATKLVLCPD